ncbi:MAG TPA: TauD/TfdA family dioxygenase [Acidimicrobiales bacterium]
MVASTLRFEPLSPTIGAEVSGIDIGGNVSDEVIAGLRQGLLDHKVLFFREQHITTEEHLAFARRFGDLEVHPVTPLDQQHHEVLMIRHDENRRGVENTWHSDVTWRPEPSLGSILRARSVPPVGGDTLFADMYAAYEGLPESVRDEIDGLSAIHDFTRVFGRSVSDERKQEMMRRYPSVEHPVVRTHPETGRQGIYVNAAFTVAIKGVSDSDSARLLALLYRQASIPEYQCRFKWRADSLAFWDNRSTQHYAVSDYFPHVREMERVTIVGDRPY